MKTDVISIYGDLHGQSAAMQEAEQTVKGLHCRICVSADANVSEG